MQPHVWSGLVRNDEPRMIGNILFPSLTSNKSSAWFAISFKLAPGICTWVPLSFLNTPPPAATLRKSSCLPSFCGVLQSKPTTWTYTRDSNMWFFVYIRNNYIREDPTLLQVRKILTCGGHFFVKWDSTVSFITSNSDFRWTMKAPKKWITN